MVLAADLVDPRCPDCGGPVGPAPTACLHCDADLATRGPVAPEELSVVDPDDPDATHMDVRTAAGTTVEHPLDPEGPVDNVLTVIVGILAGAVIGLVGTFVLLVGTGSAWALLVGLVVWLGATAHLVRRRYVMDAVARGAYGVAAVLLATPVMGLTAGGSISERVLVAAVFFVVALFPAAIAAGVGWFASRYVPADAGVVG